MNKKFLTLLILIFTALVISACGNGGENTNGNNDTQNTTETPEESNSTDSGNTTNEGSNSADTGNDSTNESNPTADNTASDYIFRSFDLEADFEGTNDAVEVDYELDDDGTESSYEDKQQGIKLTGEEALNELDSIFSTFEFDKDTPDEDVLNTVFEAFNIPKDAQNVELDIDFNDGTEKEYRQ